ncbi:ATP-binding protein [Sphingomonas insulae]|uniref:histidine kinase n=1 Tax=Sphingomonas insulae TaxID=424800 RepID=A0ABN1HQU5_9SPHN
MLGLGCLAAAATAVGGRWSDSRADAVADRAAASLARTHLGLLTSELQKFRLLPLVLTEYPDVSAALRNDDPDAAARLNRALELLAARTDAAAIYAIAANGRSVAASNWRFPTTFVGQDYGFRPYFRNAMRHGGAELFALGTVSGRPGLYLARRIDDGSRALGVIVVKVEFDRLESIWARAPGATIVTDQRGVILITSVPQWRFKPTRRLDEHALADVRRTRQYRLTGASSAPVTIDGRNATLATGMDPPSFRVAAIGAPIAEGRLIHFTPLAPALAAARSVALIWAMAALIVAGIIGGLAIRMAERRRFAREARERLEGEVVRRTAELRDANARLIVESQEREEADRRYRSAREELAQANRLGSLGQITAGVAHEINQPLATIRMFAESGTTLIDRNALDAARQNLQSIVGLTERIGTITGELRAFARRRVRVSGRTSLGSVIDGTLLLIGERARGIVDARLTDEQRGWHVAADRIRVEQVLVNLVQNALDAVAAQADPTVVIAVEAAGSDRIRLSVADNGPGIDPALDDSLFTPFATAKADGLGLGLAIARDIVRELGGDLILVPDRARGAEFTLSLGRA